VAGGRITYIVDSDRKGLHPQIGPLVDAWEKANRAHSEY